MGVDEIKVGSYPERGGREEKVNKASKDGGSGLEYMYRGKVIGISCGVFTGRGGKSLGNKRVIRNLSFHDTLVLSQFQ